MLVCCSVNCKKEAVIFCDSEMYCSEQCKTDSEEGLKGNLPSKNYLRYYETLTSCINCKNPCCLCENFRICVRCKDVVCCSCSNINVKCSCSL